MRDPRRDVLRIVCCVAATWALTACGSSDAELGDTTRTTRESVPAGPAATVSSAEIAPAGLALVREYETPEPDGGTAHLRWFAAPGATSPVLTVNVTVDVDAHARLDQAESLAAEFAATARRQGVELPPFEQTTVHGADAVVYDDPLGWRTVSWVPRHDVIVAVNGLRWSTADLMQVAEDVQIP